MAYYSDVSLYANKKVKNLTTKFLKKYCSIPSVSYTPSFRREPLGTNNGTELFTGQMSFLSPTNSVKELKKNKALTPTS